jgi:hypothetical protein
MIIERMTVILNTQAGMENLFRKELPAKIRSLFKWKSVGIQKISCEEKNLKGLASYLGKKADYKEIPIDPLNSDIFSNVRTTSLRVKI